MKKSELKQILKPIIQECIREMILNDEGLLSKIVGEVIGATFQIQEQRFSQPQPQFVQPQKPRNGASPMVHRLRQQLQNISEEEMPTPQNVVQYQQRANNQKQQVQSYNSYVEAPILEEKIVSERNPPSALDGIAPQDPGLPIEQLVGPEIAGKWSVILNNLNNCNGRMH